MESSWDSYLQPGERLLWQGAPLPGVHGKARLIGLSLFGLPFLVVGGATCIAGLMMVIGAQGWADVGLSLFIAAFSLPFAGIGLALVFWQWVEAAQAHRKVRYALSNRAAYIARNGRTRSLESYPILRDTAVSLDKARGADTVWFHARIEKDSDGDRTTSRIGFENIADGDGVFRLIRSLQMDQT